MEAAIANALQQVPVAQQSDDESVDYGSSGEEEELEGGSDGSSSEGGERGEDSGEEQSDGDASDDFDADDDAAVGSEEEGEESGEGLEEGSSGGEEGGSESEDEEGGDGRSGGAKIGFLEGGKADAFAKAFSKILEKAEKKAGDGTAAEAPILVGSKSVAKRKAEVEESAQHDREAKRLRMEMKQRGHVVPTKRGQDPAADVREKALQRLATRGVVKLFNAIAKAQKQLREAQEQTGSKAKAAKAGRASFLAELKGGGAPGAAAAGATSARKGAGTDQVLVPLAPGQATATMAQRQAKRQPQQAQGQKRRQEAGGGSSSDEEEDAGWEVLQKGFAGLQGGSKMKDWDKQASEDEEGPGEELDDSEEGSGDDRW